MNKTNIMQIKRIIFFILVIFIYILLYCIVEKGNKNDNNEENGSCTIRPGGILP